MSVNKVILVGNLGKEPDLRYTSSGAAVCNFSMATSETWMDKSGQKQERTEWHRIEVWNKLAEICNQYLTKGDKFMLRGNCERILGRCQWPKALYYENSARTVQFLGNRSSHTNSKAPMVSPMSLLAIKMAITTTTLKLLPVMP